MSKSSKRVESAGADQAPAAPISLTSHEQWSGPHDDLPTVQEVVEGMGFQLLGSVDADAPQIVPPALLAKIRHWDVEWATAGARRQEYLELAVELLGIDTVQYSPTVNIDTGVIMLTRRESPSE